MISHSLTNAQDIQRDSKQVYYVVKDEHVLYYNIPDSYVELEYIIVDGYQQGPIFTFQDRKIRRIDIPVRRLGDARVGLFDVINRTFFYEQGANTGGPVKVVEKQAYGAPVNPIAQNARTNRASRPFLTDALYINSNSYEVPAAAIQTPNSFSTVSSNVSPYSNTGFGQGRINQLADSSEIVDNINPTWNIIRGIGGTTKSHYEISNEKFYIDNKQSITFIYPVVNPISNIQAQVSIDIPVNQIDVIYHVPWLEFTGLETKYISTGAQGSHQALTVYDGLFDFYPVANSYNFAFGGVGTYITHCDQCMTRTSGYVQVGTELGNANEPQYTINARASSNLIHARVGMQQETLINEQRYVRDRLLGSGDTMIRFLVGAGYRLNFRVQGFQGKWHFLKREDDNQLSLHFMPAFAIVNGKPIIGIFESVSQKFYVADFETRPAYSGTAVTQLSNLVDINGSAIAYSWIPDATWTTAHAMLNDIAFGNSTGLRTITFADGSYFTGYTDGYYTGLGEDSDSVGGRGTRLLTQYHYYTNNTVIKNADPTYLFNDSEYGKHVFVRTDETQNNIVPCLDEVYPE